MAPEDGVCVGDWHSGSLASKLPIDRIKPRGFHGSVKEHDWSFVRRLRYLNYDQDPTQFGVELLDDVLDRFKGRCYLNADKFWENPERIATAIRDHGMTEQIVVKSRPRNDILDVTERYCADLPFMGIVRRPEEIEILRKRKLRYVGSEVLFDSDESVFATREFVDGQHRDGLLVWVNAIVYDHRVVLAGGHSDDRAVCGDKDGSWGWIANRGYDLMQTDWTLSASMYLAATGRRSCLQ